MGGGAADLTVALCDFASAFRRDIASEPTRAANALRDLLGPLAEVSSGQRRALSDVVADGRLRCHRYSGLCQSARPTKNGPRRSR